MKWAPTTPSRRRDLQQELRPYERLRLSKITVNNARLQALGLPALAAIFRGRPNNVSPVMRRNHRNHEDSGSDYDPQVDKGNVIEDADISSLDEEEALNDLQSICTSSPTKASKSFEKSKKATKKASKEMGPGVKSTRPPKRVKADPQTEQPPRVSTRSHAKQLTFGPTSADLSDPGVEVPALGHTRSHARNRSAEKEGYQPPGGEKSQPMSDDFAMLDAPSAMDDAWQAGDGVGHSKERILLHDAAMEEGQAGDGTGHSEERLQLHDAAMDDEGQAAGLGVGRSENRIQLHHADPKTRCRQETMGHTLDRMTRVMKCRLPVTVREGKLRPKRPVEAAKLASESGIAIRTKIPIFTHWKEYKKDENKDHFNRFVGTLGERLALDIENIATKAACIDLFRTRIRNERNRLKKKYFDNTAANQVRLTSPVDHITDSDWRNLVAYWSDPKNQETSAKNKLNQSKVKFPQTTGSRSYVAHCYTVKQKCKEGEPDAIDYFKECHDSSKKGFTEPVKEAIAEMETLKAQVPTEDDVEPKTSTQIVAEVLSQSSAKSTFLRNVGLKPTSSKDSKDPKVQQLENALAAEEERSAGLVQEVGALKERVRESDEKLLKYQEEMEVLRKRQEHGEAILAEVLKQVKVKLPSNL